MRKISEGTNNSNRVVKNALLSLENLGHVRRVIKEGKILPEWEITKDGRKVANRMKPKEYLVAAPMPNAGLSINGQDEPQLLLDAAIMKEPGELTQKLKEMQGDLLFHVNAIANALQRVMSPLYDSALLATQDLVGDLLQDVKSIRRNLESPLPKLPIARAGAKKSELKASETKFHERCTNLYLIATLLQYYAPVTASLANEIANDAITGSYNTLHDRLVQANNLLYLLVTVTNRYYHVSTVPGAQLPLSRATLDALLGGNLPSFQELLDEIVPEIIAENPADPLNERLKDAILQYFEQSRVNADGQLGPEAIPLSAIYRNLRNLFPDLRFSIESMEEIMDDLAAGQYLPEIIQPGGDLKYLPLRVITPTEIEQQILAYAARNDSFTLGEIAAALSLPIEEVKEVLGSLTDMGILRYTPSYREGERWYLAG